MMRSLEHATHTLVVSAPIRQMAERVRHQWRAYQPVAASLWGPVVLDTAEDLSADGLKRWAATLKSLARQLHTVRQKAVTLVDVVLCDELERFVEEKLYQAEVQQPFQRSVGAYLQQVGASLLPFALGLQAPSASCRWLCKRLRAINAWLELGVRRFQQHRFAYAPHEDVRTARHLAAALDDLVGLWAAELQDRNHLQDVCSLRDEAKCRLQAWSRQLQKAASPQTHRFRFSSDWERLFQRVWGTEQSPWWWCQRLFERLDEEIGALNVAQKHGVTVSRLFQSKNGLRVSGSFADLLNARVSGQNVLPWLQQVYQRLRQMMRGTFLSQTAPPAAIDLIPPVAEVFLANGQGMFMPSLDDACPGDGRMFITRRIQGLTDLPLKGKIDLVSMVAHELCPGHYEQFARFSSSPLAPYLDFLQAPAGLEGWAVYGEQVVASWTPPAEVVFRYHRVRRLLPVVALLLYLEKGKEVANATLNQVVRRVQDLPDDLRRSLALLWATPPVYMIGLIGVEQALKELHAALDFGRKSSVEPLAVRELFLSQGPLTPCSAQRLAMAQLQFDESQVDKER